MAELQRACQGEDEGNVLHLVWLLADDLDVRRWSRGEAAGEGRVGVDVELEQVEEGVRHEGNGAVLFRLYTVVEFEGRACLVTHGEGGPFYLVGGVFDVFACFAATCQHHFARDKLNR